MALPLESLGDETWGERFLRARRRSGVRLDRAAELISLVVPTSYGTLVRLEQATEQPRSQRQRLVALLALLVYGIDPQDFGLSKSDLPPAIDEERVADLLKRQKRCTSLAA